MFLALSSTWAGEKYNFNPQWLLHVGDVPEASHRNYDDSAWQEVTLPRAFNEDEAFRVGNREVTDTITWYRKHFRLPAGTSRGSKVFIEFEGVRQAADFYLNGHWLGLHENGVMAVGLDLTPYISYKGENVIAVRIDNDWDYQERDTGTKFQWSDRNFNANYGGLPKNVWLHITGPVYQTLPLYSNLGTTGVYIYAKDIKIGSGTAVIHAESEVRNDSKKAYTVGYRAELIDRDGTLLQTFEGSSTTLQPGQTAMLRAETRATGLHFWSWGYGYLYTVRTSLWADGQKIDEVNTRTGFRKTRFGNGKVWLNDRVIMLKGFAQRSSNEWPAVGLSVPPWLSDYSNGLMVEGGANLVRWMHITPWKQDVESCDRVGLLQAMPAGDAEKDREGRQWEQRLELMRDAIVYNRNNPSIIFYESGNESISREHMLAMRAQRDRYDPYGGRAIGSREMLDIREAEYGGEMLYINKSAHHPMWATEYCRDEGLRKYWDAYSYPYHPEGADVPVYPTLNYHKPKDTRAYNRNQDSLALEHVIRWYDYWRERPGTGDRISSGGVKIVFSDTNTHFRGSENYRRSGSVDPMRIPKDSYYVHQVMWDGWVDTDTTRIHIIGHWNYDEGTVKPINVVSTANSVELRFNGLSLGRGRNSYHFLHTFDSVAYRPGLLEAIGYDLQGKECCRTALQTAGEPRQIRLSLTQSPSGWKADGADMVLVQVEVVDVNGLRCPLADDMIHFDVDGPADWRGGLALGEGNYVLAKDLPVECGVNRVLVRSLTTPGTVNLTATSPGLQSSSLQLTSLPVAASNGLSTYIAANDLQGHLTRGETPMTPSYTDTKVDVRIASATAGAHQDEVWKSFDDNELSEWTNDGRLGTGWITYHLERRALVDEVCLKLTGWRKRSYQIEICAGDEVVWSGFTPKSLGYIHLDIRPTWTDELTIRLCGAGTDNDAFAGIVEVAVPSAGELDFLRTPGGESTGHEIRIVEVEFKENLF